MCTFFEHYFFNKVCVIVCEALFKFFFIIVFCRLLRKKRNTFKLISISCEYFLNAIKNIIIVLML